MTAAALPPDLEALESFLLSDASPDDCMQISELDGFLTGVAIGPDFLLPSQYLPTIWGGEEPVFETIAQGQAITRAIFARYNEIIDTAEAGVFEPIVWTGPEGEPVGDDWASGFAAAVELNPDGWAPLANSEDCAPFLFMILALAADENGEIAGDGRDDEEDFIVEASERIPEAVEEIAAFWRPRRSPVPGLLTAGGPPPGPRSVVKVGRNDPCPCGSGRKWKKCCGAAG